MDKRMVLAMALSLVVLFVYSSFFAPKPPKPKNPPPAVAAQGTGQGGDPVAGDGKGPVAGDPPGDGGGGDSGGAGGTAGPAELPDQADIVIGTERLEQTVTQRGAAVSGSLVWGNPAENPRTNASAADPGRATLWMPEGPGALSVDLRGEQPPLYRRKWKLEARDDGGVTATIQVAGLEITRILVPSTDPQAPFHSDVQLRVRNLSAEPGRRPIIEIFSAVFGHVDTLVTDQGVVVSAKPDDQELYSPTDVREEIAENRALALDFVHTSTAGWNWIGARLDFFVGALEPRQPLPADTVVGFANTSQPSKDPTKALGAVASYRIPVTVPPVGESEVIEFRYYTGPNSETVFAQAPYTSLKDAVPHRMFSIGPIEDLLSWMLRTFASLGIGYGGAILMLTLLVRGALFPLSRKSQVSMRIHANKMAVLQPKMEAIRAKYKDSRKQQQKIMELMREEKASLVPGGCLIAFVQMPIWISLFGVLQTTFEMRYEGFLWFDNLTAPDKLLELPFAAGWPILDGWLHLLPILMMITWFISSSMTELPADPQQRQTAKMMRYMPLLFGVMLYAYPSGLALYMTLSALWSIGETQLIRRVWLNKIPQVRKQAAAAAS